MACRSETVFSFTDDLHQITAELEGLSFEHSSSGMYISYVEALLAKDYKLAFTRLVGYYRSMSKNKSETWKSNIDQEQMDTFILGRELAGCLGQEQIRKSKIFPKVDYMFFHLGVAVARGINRNLKYLKDNQVEVVMASYFSDIQKRKISEYRRLNFEQSLVVDSLDRILCQMDVENIKSFFKGNKNMIYWFSEVLIKTIPHTKIYFGTSPGLRKAIRCLDPVYFEVYLAKWVACLEPDSPMYFEMNNQYQVRDLVSDFMGHIKMTEGRLVVKQLALKFWEEWCAELEKFGVAYQRCMLRKAIKAKLSKSPLSPAARNNFMSQADGLFGLSGGECPCLACVRK